MTSQLSPAQIQERRDAARARWDKARQAALVAAGGAAGGALAGVGATQAVTAVRRRATAQKDQALAPVRAADRHHRLNQAFIDVRADAAKAGIKSERNFLSTVPRAFDIKFRAARAAGKALAEHKAANSEPFFDSTTGESGEATLDLPGETALADRAYLLRADDAQRFRQIADDIRAKGRNPVKVARAGSTHTPKVETFTRKSRGKAQLSLSASTRAALEETFASDNAQRAVRGNDLSPFHDLGIRSIKQLQTYFQDLPPQHRKGFAQSLKYEANLPNIKLARPVRVSDVANTGKVIAAHEMTVPGFPGKETRRALRTELLSDISARHTYRTGLERERADAEMATARQVAAGAGSVLRYLRPRALGRHGIIGTAIGAGALLGAFAAARAQAKPTISKKETVETSLAKAAGGAGGDDDAQPGAAAPKSTARRLLDAADGIEDDLAAGVARALASWKDAVTEDSIASGDVMDQFDQPLMDGMAPLDKATAAGIAAPAHIVPPDDKGGGDESPKLLHFGFNVRADAVKRYAQQYRYNRVRDITDAQRKNIRQIIIDATNKADPPALIARKIRDVVGLTAKQADIVANYRQNLEASDPRALTYSLRDKRFDRTFQKALKDKTPLSTDQVDKMVDAYQRRFIAFRAMTIARTEAIRATNNGHVKTVTDFLAAHPDYTVAKTWIATEDDRTRPDHRGLHRQTVIGMQNPFVCDSGETIRWPHDPKGAAKEVINCRCQMMTVLVPRSAAAKHGPKAYGTPTGKFWSGPRKPFDMNDPGDIFDNPELEPA